ERPFSRWASLGSVARLPERLVTTDALGAQVLGTWDATRMVARTGFAIRHFVAPGPSAAALGAPCASPRERSHASRSHHAHRLRRLARWRRADSATAARSKLVTPLPRPS